MPFDAIPRLFAVLASLLPGWPDDSALGLNAGVSPAKAGLAAFYAHGNNQWNLGALYGVGTTDAQETDLRLAFTYNRLFPVGSHGGPFAAAGMSLTHTVETAPPSGDPDDPASVVGGGDGTGAAWHPGGTADPELTFAMGYEFRFGARGRFGLHADIGAGYTLARDIDDKWRPRAGAGLTYRFAIN
jgi:hypothetical protein